MADTRPKAGKEAAERYPDALAEALLGLSVLGCRLLISVDAVDVVVVIHADLEGIKDPHRGGNHEGGRRAVLVGVHQKGRTDGVAHLQHFVKGLDVNDLIPLSMEGCRDLLDKGAVARHETLDLDAVVDIVVSRGVGKDKEDRRADHVQGAEHDAQNKEHVLIDVARASHRLILSVREAGRHDGLRLVDRKREMQGGKIRILVFARRFLARARDTHVQRQL